MFSLIKWVIVIAVIAPAVISFYDIDANNIHSEIKRLTSEYVEPIIDTHLGKRSNEDVNRT